MGGVTGKDPVKVAPRKDEGPVQDLGANGPHPAFGVRVGLRGTDGREADPRTLGSEHGVEGAGVLGVSIADEEANGGGQLTSRAEVPSLLGGVAGASGRLTAYRSIPSRCSDSPRRTSPRPA
jgi:hypothetical protein